MKEEAVRAEMKKIWDLMKKRIPEDRLWAYFRKYKEHDFANWVLEEILERRKKSAD